MSPTPGVGLTAATAPKPVAQTTAGAAAAVRTALAQVGKPYVWAAGGPNAFDCSGLTSYAWRAGGVTIPHYARLQRMCGHSVSRDELMPGDLVFPYADLSHVAMYVGNGNIVEAANPAVGVIGPHPMGAMAGGACRVSGLPSGTAVPVPDGGTGAQNAGLLSGLTGDIFGSIWQDTKPLVFTGIAVAGGLALVVGGAVITARPSA